MAMITAERQLEEALVTKLRDLKYEYRPAIRDRATLEANFREKFEALNRVTLTDGEFQRLLDEIVTPDVYEAARSLRNREAFIRDDGTPLNYTLVNIKDWCKNAFEVVSQLRINTDNSHHCYDVILLIGGVPVVQIEIKTLGISPRRAMEQIVDYKNDPGNGYTKTLLCFVQLFIVSNRTDTWYFANNNARHFAFDADERFLPIYQFAAEDNTKITHIDDFADRFLAKCTLGQMISKYMVLIASEQKLLMMRPYQIYAVKAIVDCIDQNCGNGYIWHTTGSGKTLTSFKASTLLKTNESIHKCLFVVDRKDLDRQTREEFNRFQENCVEENTNTAALVRRLQSDDYADKVIVTTIQKLALALDENSKHNMQNIAQGRSTFKQRLEHLRNKRMVFIFDECHRSQFGENHKARNSSRTPSSSASLAPRSSRTTRPLSRSRETSPPFEPPRTSSRKSSTPTQSLTRSRIGTSSASTSITTSPRTPLPSPSRLSRSRRSPRPSSTSTMPRPEADASTRCSLPPRSTTPSSTTRSSRSSRPSVRPPTPSSSLSRSPPWCFFLAIVELALDDDGTGPYNWVKHIYIDDPISSLDGHNAIAVANHLAKLLKRPESRLKTVISTHHTLFFNVLCNELNKANKYFLSRDGSPEGFLLRKTGDRPFFHHVAALAQLYEADRDGKLYTHHFNMLRAILEKTASFHGYQSFSACIKRDAADEDGILHTRLINILSHGNYSLFEPQEMLEENKRYFRKILHEFINRYPFNPVLFPSEPATEMSDAT